MPLEITMEITGSLARINLVGQLDAATSPRFGEVLKSIAPNQLTHLVLAAHALEFLASAGVRELLIAKQKIAPAARVYVIAPQEPVLNTLRRTGIIHSIIVLDEYPAGE